MTPKQLWIKALRSGKYTQTRHKLLREDGSCCALGVACLVYEEHVEPLNKKLVAYLYYSINGEYNFLPREVYQWLGCSPLGSLKEHNSVMSLNDINELTFLEIANTLENSEFA